MRAAVFPETNVLPRNAKIEIPERHQNEVMTRIAASGICGSDILVFHGTANMKDCTSLFARELAPSRAGAMPPRAETCFRPVLPGMAMEPGAKRRWN